MQGFFDHCSWFCSLMGLKYTIQEHFLSYRITHKATGRKWHKYSRQLAYENSFCWYLRFTKQSWCLFLLLSAFQSLRHVNHLPVISITPCAESRHCSNHSNCSVYVQTRKCFSTPASLYSAARLNCFRQRTCWKLMLLKVKCQVHLWWL